METFGSCPEAYACRSNGMTGQLNRASAPNRQLGPPVCRSGSMMMSNLLNCAQHLRNMSHWS
jgi:hypothetical protein